ncbi:MAG: STM4011 family radical SAM protein [Filifactor alocis]|nr:STM4011 family radical SAM protein [Filifactor alocis]
MLETIYYRGFVNFCNYSCSYCPFSKKKRDLSLLREDMKVLDCLYEELKREKIKKSLMITPYGEVMCHEEYRRKIASFSSLEQLEYVGVQTNLSFEVPSFLEEVRKQGGRLDKIVFWATWHPDFADPEDFAAKVDLLSGSCKISVGAVATRNNLEEMKRMRKLLKREVYFWLNATDKLRASFKQDEIEKFCEIDPMFSYEFVRNREEFKNCASHRNTYIDGGLVSGNCFFKKRKKIDTSCSDHRRCNCYLGYSNFVDTKLRTFFGDTLAPRLPQKRKFECIFLDFDGILTDGGGRVRSDLSSILEELGGKARLYLATARSYGSVRQKLGRKMAYFKGGAFSDGADLREEDFSFREKFLLDKGFVSEFCSRSKMSWKTHIDEDEDGEVLRLGLPPCVADEVADEGVQRRKYFAKCYLQHKEASKKNGILKIADIHGLKKQDVLFVSDNVQDDEVFRELPYTVSPLYRKELRKKSSYSLNLEHLIWILE